VSSVTEYNIHSLPSVSKRKAKNVEILEENTGRESTVLTGHLPGEWSATRKLWQKSRWVLVNAVTGDVES